MINGIKIKVHKKCIEYVQSKIDFCLKSLFELSQGANDASKSSAGDKHETSRAMAQLEQEKIGNQLKDFEMMMAQLLQIDMNNTTKTVSNGSLVETTKGFFYISVPIGKIEIEDMLFFALSSKSPLGKQLIGLMINQNCIVNTTEYKIVSIL